MQRTASIVLFLMVAALTAWLAHSSAQWMPSERRLWRHLAAGVSAVVGLPAGLCYGVLLQALFRTPKPPSRRALLFVTACGLVLFAAGVGMLFAATAHRIAGSPPYVWITWLPLGLVVSLIAGLLVRAARRLNEEAEVRQLQARDISSA